MYRIKNWREYQGAPRKKRGAMPWFKLDKGFFQDYHVRELPEAKRYQLIGLFSICDHLTGVIDQTPEEIRFMIGCKSLAMKDFQHFIEPWSTSGQPVDNQWLTSGQPRVEESRVEESRVEESIKSIDHFSEFWDLYPNKKAKATAKTAWTKAISKVENHDVILNALHSAVKSVKWRKDGGEFIPHPATWLNAERWTDEYETTVDISKTEKMEGLGL